MSDLFPADSTYGNSVREAISGDYRDLQDERARPQEQIRVGNFDVTGATQNLLGPDVFIEPSHGAGTAGLLLGELGTRGSYESLRGINEGFRQVTGIEMDPEQHLRQAEDRLLEESRQARLRLAPDPLRTSKAGQLLFGFSELGALAASGGESAILPALLTFGGTGSGTLADLQAEGVDEATAYKAAAIEGGFNALMTGLPASLNVPGARWNAAAFARRAASGAAIWAPFGVAHRAVMGEYLRSQGVDERIASRYDWRDGEALLSDAIISAAFGGLMGHTSPGRPVGEVGLPEGEPTRPTMSGAAHLDEAHELANHGDLTEAFAHATLAAHLGEQEGANLARQLAEDGGEEVFRDGYTRAVMMGMEEGVLHPSQVQIDAAMEVLDNQHARLSGEGVALNIAADAEIANDLRAAEIQAANGEEMQVPPRDPDAEYAPNPDLLNDVNYLEQQFDYHANAIEEARAAGDTAAIAKHEAAARALLERRDQIARGEVGPQVEAVAAIREVMTEIGAGDLTDDLRAQLRDQGMSDERIAQLLGEARAMHGDRPDEMLASFRANKKPAHGEVHLETLVGLRDLLLQRGEKYGALKTIADITGLERNNVTQRLRLHDLVPDEKHDLVNRRSRDMHERLTRLLNDYLAHNQNALRTGRQPGRYSQASLERLMDAAEKLVAEHEGKMPRGWDTTLAERSGYQADTVRQYIFSMEKGTYGEELAARAQALPNVSMAGSGLNATVVARLLDQGITKPQVILERLNAARAEVGKKPTNINSVYTKISQIRKARRDGESLYSLTDHGAASVRELNAYAEDAYGAEGWAALRNAANLEVFSNRQDLAASLEAAGERALAESLRRLPEDPSGLYLPATKKTYIFADHVSPETLKATLLHEVGWHSNIRQFLGQRLYNETVRGLLRMHGQQHPLVVEAFAFASIKEGEGSARFNEELGAYTAELAALDGERSPFGSNDNTAVLEGRIEAARAAGQEGKILTGHAEAADRALAWLMENAPDFPLVNRILARLRQWVWTKFGQRFGDALTIEDVRQLAVASLRRVQEQGRREAAEMTPIEAPSVGAASAGRDDLLGANDRGLLPRLRGMAEGDASFDNTYPRRFESPRNPAGVAYTEGEPNLGFHANDDTLPGTATPQSLEAVTEPPAPTGLKIEHQGANWRIVDYGNLTSDGRPRTVRVLPTGSRYQDARAAFDDLRRTRSAPDAGAAMGEQTTRPPWPEGVFNDASGGNANLRGAPELAAAWRDDDAFRQAFEAISNDRSVSKSDVKALLDHFFPHNAWRNGATRADLLTTLRQMRNTDMLRQNRLAAMSGPLPEYQPHRGPAYQVPEYPDGRVTIDGLRRTREPDVSPNDAPDGSPSKDEPLASMVTPGPRLTALHNLTATNLLAAAKLGGLAVPSIGIVPEGRGLRDFGGEITLIGRRDLADPANEPVYNADIWSRTFPPAEFDKVSSRAISSSPFYKSLRQWDEHYGEGFRGAASALWDNSVNAARPDEAINSLARDMGAMAAWLEHKGETPSEPITREKPTAHRAPWSRQPAWLVFVRDGHWERDNLGWDSPERIAFNQEAGEAARKAIDEYVASTRKGKPRAVHSALKDALVEQALQEDGSISYGLLHDARQSAENTGKIETDQFATREALEAQIGERGAEFRQWIEDRVRSLYGEPFFRLKNKKTAFTLANVVEYMTGRVKNQQDHLTFGEGKARAASAKKFTSLEEMRRAAKLIKSPEEVEAAQKETSQAAEQWRSALTEYYGPARNVSHARDKFGATWESFDAAMRALSKVMGGAKTESNMETQLRREGFVELPPHIVEDGIALAKQFVRTPVPYFEGKPQRAVSLNEFAGAVIPEGTSSAVRDVLEAAGLPIREYAKSDRGAQSEAAAQFASELGATQPDVLFSFGPGNRGQNGENSVEGNHGKADPIESEDYQERLRQVRESVERQAEAGDAARSEPESVQGVAGEPAGRGRGQSSAGEGGPGSGAPDRSLLRAIVDVSGLEFTKKSEVDRGDYRLRIDTPFASDADAVLRSEVKLEKEGGPTWIDFDMIDGSNPKETRLPGIYLQHTRVADGAKGAGIGTWLYRHLIEWADRRGLPVYSDALSVSRDAQKIYARLGDMGYQVERLGHPKRAADGSLLSTDGQPVYRVSKRGEIETPLTGAPLPRDDYQIDGPTLRQRMERVRAREQAFAPMASFAGKLRALSEAYNKLTPEQQALADNPDMRIATERGEQTARQAIEEAEAAQKRAKELREGYEAAAKCAIRHGGSMAAQSFVSMAARGGVGAGLGQVFGAAAGIPAGIVASNMLASNSERVAPNSPYARLRRQQAHLSANEQGRRAGLDEPAQTFQPPLGTPLAQARAPADAVDTSAPEEAQPVQAQLEGGAAGRIQTGDVPAETTGHAPKPGQAVPAPGPSDRPAPRNENNPELTGMLRRVIEGESGPTVPVVTPRSRRPRNGGT